MFLVLIKITVSTAVCVSVKEGVLINHRASMAQKNISIFVVFEPPTLTIINSPNKLGSFHSIYINSSRLYSMLLAACRIPPNQEDMSVYMI